MTPLQKALKEKAVLERALEMAAEHIILTTTLVGTCNIICPLQETKTKPWCSDMGRICNQAIFAHFKAKAKGGR